MPLNEQQVQQYRELGYCLVEGLIPPAAIEAVRQRTLEIVDNKPDWPSGHFQVVDPGRYQGVSGGALPGGIQRPASQEEVFTTVADHPALQEAMARLLGGQVQRYTDQIGVKHGVITEEQGGCSYFHQDSYYWHIEPHLGCNCWIPTGDVGAEAIALAVMPRSQAGWVLHEHESYFDDPPLGHEGEDGFVPFKRHRVPLEQVDFSAELLVPMRAGDGLFFTNYTWHRSEPNRSGRTMAFYAIAYQRVDETGTEG